VGGIAYPIDSAIPPFFSQEYHMIDQSDGRLRRLVKRREELVSEIAEAERELRSIDRELLDRRVEEQFVDAGRWPNL
jgi:hypothetical protein